MRDLLLEMKPQHNHLVCVDSDGCVFDNMELKHKECFCPATVNVWGLQGVSRFARESAEYVNLYSKSRGTNRYPALIRTLELLGKRSEARERGYTVPDLTPLKKWISVTPVLSLDSLKKYYAEVDKGAELLKTVIEWSEEVDNNIKHIVRNVTPFPHVKAALNKLSQFADIVIVSATPHEAIIREWEENGLLDYVTVVAGQELGTKEDCIKKAYSGRYEPENVLMIGDAPGDHQAAEANGVLFYPVVPGYETESWQRMGNEAAEFFCSGAYGRDYMKQRVEEFDNRLLDNPPWETAENDFAGE